MLQNESSSECICIDTHLKRSAFHAERETEGSVKRKAGFDAEAIIAEYRRGWGAMALPEGRVTQKCLIAWSML